MKKEIKNKRTQRLYGVTFVVRRKFRRDNASYAIIANENNAIEAAKLVRSDHLTKWNRAFIQEVKLIEVIEK